MTEQEIKKNREMQEKLFSKYLSQSKILIADASQASRARLTKTMLELGAKMHLIQGFASFDQALHAMEEFRPKIVMTDYMIGRQSGFDLLSTFRSKHPEDYKETLFVLITSNSSQSLVARAAEEDVDTFVLKPYTIKILKDTLISTAINKFYPSEYIQIIDQGKEFLLQGQPAAAIPLFNKAIGLHPQPTLACFYHGQAEFMLQSLETAEGKYKEGLGYNKIHYKCLVSLYELLMTQKRYFDAYEVVRTIAQYFPANPARLSSVLRLAVLTENYQDVEKYYQFFLDIDARTDELITYVCAGLSTCTRYYLQNNQAHKALALFDKLATTANGKPRFMRYGIEYFYEFKHYKELPELLSKIKDADRGGDDYDIAKFITESSSKAANKVIQEASDRIEKKKQDSYCLYLVLLNKLIELRYFEDAARKIDEAIKRYPTRFNTFVRIKNAYLDEISKAEATLGISRTTLPNAGV